MIDDERTQYSFGQQILNIIYNTLTTAHQST